MQIRAVVTGSSRCASGRSQFIVEFMCASVQSDLPSPRLVAFCRLAVRRPPSSDNTRQRAPSSTVSTCTKSASSKDEQVKRQVTDLVHRGCRHRRRSRLFPVDFRRRRRRHRRVSPVPRLRRLAASSALPMSV